MQILNFVVLSVIIAPHNVLTPHISKTHLPIVSVNVHELELNWCLFRMRFNLNIIFASNAWGEMKLNELKRASMNLNQSK